MGLKVGDVFLALGFDVEDGKLKPFDDGIVKLTGNMWAAAAAAAGAVYAVAAFVNEAVKGAVALQNLNQQFDINEQKAQEWSLASQMGNVALSSEAAYTSIKNITKAMNDLKFGQGNAKPFAFLGINPSDDPFDALRQLREKMPQNLARYGRPKVTSLLQEMGLDPNFMGILTSTGKQFDDFMKIARHFALNKDEIKKLNDLGFALKMVGIEWDSMTAKFSADLAPKIMRVLDYVLPKVESIFGGIRKVMNFTIENLTDIKALLISFSPIIALWAVQTYPFTVALIGILALLKAIGEYKEGDGGFIDRTDKKLRSWNDRIGEFYKWVGEDLTSAFHSLGETIKKYLIDPITYFFSSRFDSDVEKWISGKFSWLKDVYDFFNSASKSGANFKKDVQDNGLMGATWNAVTDSLKSAATSLSDIATSLSPDMDINAMVYQGAGLMGASKNFNFTNTYHIQSNANAEDVAHEVQRRQQQQLNYGMSDMTRGSKN